jgi:guanylate kinase
MKLDSTAPPGAHDARDKRRGLLFIVAGPSGAGKTKLVAQLLQHDPNLVVSISHTTRPRRPSETDGVDYHFVDAATFARMTTDKAFLEHAEVFGNHYGTSKEAVSQELDQGRDVVLEIDWQGARLVRKHYPEAISIFILPPSTEALTERLERRGQDDQAVITARTNQAREDMAHYADFDYLVVNDHFTTAAADLSCIVRAVRLGTTPQQQRLKTLLGELLLKDT